MPVSVDYLVVGGGGSGGHAHGGGGGGGGVRAGSLLTQPSTNYIVTIGEGGASKTIRGRGNKGSNSVFSTINATGGGGGGSQVDTSEGQAGGCGGGGGNATSGTKAGGAGNEGGYTPVEGYAGGSASAGSAWVSAGGGGAGGAGGAASGSTPGNGGIGFASSITGQEVYYGGGGGGCGENSGSGGSGGQGGGTAGSIGSAGSTSAAANTGGGSGGTRDYPGTGLTPSGAGGSGVVILKYPSDHTITNPGGGLTYTTLATVDYKITTFTSGTGNIQINPPILSINFNNGDLTKTGSLEINAEQTLTYPSTGGILNSGHATGWNISQGIRISSFTTPASTRDKTYIAWYKGTQTVAGGTYSPSIPIFGWTGNDVYSGFGVSGGKITIANAGQNLGTTSVNTGEWFFLAWTITSAGVCNGFVNGVKEVNNVSVNTSYPGPYKIGSGYAYSGTEAPTALDSVRVYEGVLSDAEILAIYQADIAVPTVTPIFSISPTVGGKSTWDLNADGPLTLGTSGTWTITPQSNFSGNVKMWGAGGGAITYGSSPGGGGGAAAGTVSFESGVSYDLIVGAGGTGAAASRNGAGGGGGTGIQKTSGTVPVLVAGGGGGGHGGSSRQAGAGGGTSGQAGEGGGGGGGSQSAPGAGGSGGRRTGGAGSGRNGGVGAGSSSGIYPGGTGFGNGGAGSADGGDAGSGGGGGGYYGGGGGGGDVGGYGGGGGSGYFDPTAVTDGILYQGILATPGLNGDLLRGTAGTAADGNTITSGSPGKIYIESSVINTNVPFTIDYIVVAGGASGGRVIGGGGGAGGVVTGQLPKSLASYVVVIGAGGASQTADNLQGNDGQVSSLGSITAVGGGGGGAYAGKVGKPGGSGGGGGGNEGSTQQQGGAGTSGQGNSGGIGGARPSSYDGGGGGGGAGTAGGNFASTTGGAGGAGVNWFDGAFYGGGGGGNGYSGTGGSAGIGGGSSGGNGNTAPTAATVNTGGGGGGSGYSNSAQGGSGIVKIRYPSNKMTATGGTITTSGAYTVHTFTTGDTFQITQMDPGIYSPSQVDFGDSFDINLVTSNVADGTLMPYTITGVTTAAIGGTALSGNLTITNNSATLSITSQSGRFNTKTMTFSANNLTADIELVGGIDLEYFVVGGGGGGGSDMGGGGGGATVLSGSLPKFSSAKSFTVTVGGGGVGAPAGTDQVMGSPGGNSSIVAVDATNPTITLTGNNGGLGISANELALTIEPGSAWSSYRYLPSYLTGLITTLRINTSDTAAFSTDKAVRAYLLRDPAWNAVSLTGWTQLESGKSYITAAGSVTVYYQDFVAGGPYTIDSNSAMYMFDDLDSAKIKAYGGGGGASDHTGATVISAAHMGGSGGGASGQNANQGLGYPLKGYNGAQSAGQWYPGGGGGAGGAGAVNPANGGAGIVNDFIGTSYYWAAGGGGSGYTGNAGNGGQGGGGGGAPKVNTGGNAGTGGINPASDGEVGTLSAQTNKRGGNAGANTGSGGGGGAHYNLTNNGGNGGSGFVAIKYRGFFLTSTTNGTTSTLGNDNLVTFITSGTFSISQPSSGIYKSKETVYQNESVIVSLFSADPDGTTVSYTISGVITSDIDGDPLTGSIIVDDGKAALTINCTHVTGKTMTVTIDSESITVPLAYALDSRYLIVAGGGGGGMDMGGGGGGGGVIDNSAVRLSPGAYQVIVGAGGTGAPTAGTGPGTQGRTSHQYTIPATAGQNSEFLGLTAVGGGIGGSSYYPYTPGAAGGNGGSGGGASGYSDGGTRSGGTGVSGQGFRGGNGGGQYYSGGGGGAGGQGVDSTAQSNGGPGRLNDILGTAYYWAGGGGGSGYSIQGGNGGIGGGGGGAVGTTTGGAGLNAGQAGGGGSTVSQTNKPGGNGGANTGGGGGGGSHYTATNQGGNGGGGIVAVRYSGGQRAVGGTVTTVGSDTLHTFLTSGTLIVLAGEGLTATMTAAYFGDTFTVYLTANEPDNTTVPYTITGVTSAEINDASLTGNFTLVNGIASLEIVTVAGTLDNKTFSISAYGYTATVTLTYLISMTAPSIAGWGADIVITIVTENLAPGATVPYTISGVTTADLLGASLTGNITIAAGTDPKTSTLTIETDPTLLTTKTLTVSIPGGFSTSTSVTFISVPRNITLITAAAGTPAVISTTLSDLKESQSVANQWDYSQVIPTFLVPGGGPLKISPTDPGDLAEQVSVATSPQGHGSEQVLEQVNMVGTRSSPTYVYSDGAPVAAPAPGEQLIQIWYIT